MIPGYSETPRYSAADPRCYVIKRAEPMFYRWATARARFSMLPVGSWFRAQALLTL